jgi:hypothetical protein
MREGMLTGSAAYSARIKIHRYTAFMNIPIFSQKHCDLPTSPVPPKKRESVIGTLDYYDTPLESASASKTSPPNEHISQLDCCSTDIAMNSAPGIPPPQDDAGIGILSCCTPEAPVFSTTSKTPSLDSSSDPSAPFTRSLSTKICRTAALNIVHSFHTLPYPSPLVSPPSPIPLPRAMPVFACCAMQCNYALLMLSHKASRSHEYSDDDIVLQGYKSHLRQALGVVVGSLENYSAAYEALDGMRGWST